MKKSLFLIAAILMTLALIMTSCQIEGGDESDDDGENLPGITLDGLADEEDNLKAIYQLHWGTDISYEEWKEEYAEDIAGLNGLLHLGEDGYWYLGDLKTAWCIYCNDYEIRNGSRSAQVSYKEGSWIILYVPDGEGGYAKAKSIELEDGVLKLKVSSSETWELRGCDYHWGNSSGDAADCKHSWSITHKPPTCTEEGYSKRTCNKCDAYEYYNYQPASGEHDYVVKSDEEIHWFMCSDCDAIDAISPHFSNDGDEMCDVCFCEMVITLPGAPSYDTYWKKTPIIFELTESSDGKQFTSGTRRYYAGGDTSSNQVIDINIRNRNANAQKAANVEIKYSYLPDTYAHEWSRSVETIEKTTKTYTAGKSTDIYCNFVYDLTAATLKGCFANLKANTPGCQVEYGIGRNFFRFNDSDYVIETDPSKYFDSGVGEGYFYQYMQSLTLSDDKLYCLASDFTIDVVRAFLVVPVNIEMMNGIDPKNLPADLKANPQIGYTSDMSNIEFFYRVVWANKWNYQTLYKFSKSVYKDLGTSVTNGKAGADITDYLGFAISENGGLSASGILYTSSVEILNKKALTPAEKAAALADVNLKDYVAGDYLITYPDTNPAFNAYATALNNLFEMGKNNGICTVDDNNLAGVSIRANFVGGKILFGSIVQLHSLEDPDYQSMRSGSGFGIVPVPVYKAGDEYQTLVHNNARIIAIARLSDRFEQISAFLDYQSRTSSGILNMYYSRELAQSLYGEVGDQNPEMLRYIRNHVRNVFDKTYEDVMGDLTDPEAIYRSWHEILRLNRFQISSMTTKYAKLIPTKSADLKTVIKAWNELR